MGPLSFKACIFPQLTQPNVGNPLHGVRRERLTDNLASMPGFAKMNGVAVGSDGRADPQSQLFRSSAVGVETGPIISQVCVWVGVLHIKPVFLHVDIQNTQCPRRLFHSKEIRAM